MAPIDMAGPMPGPLHTTWTKTLAISPDAGDIRDLTLVGGALLSASPQGVEAIDARSGVTLWRSTSFDRSGVSAFAVSGQQAIIVNRGGQWISVHVSTGKVSWRSQSPAGSLIPYSDKLQALATSTTVPVVSPNTPTIVGIDSQTGHTKWNIGQQQLFNCAPDMTKLTQTASVETKRYVSSNWLAIPVKCGTRDAVVGIDASSGRSAWRHQIMTPEDSPQASMSDRFVGISGDGYGIFEQGIEKESHKLIVQDPSGQTKAELGQAQAFDTWGPLSPLTTAGNSNTLFPFLRNGKHYIATFAPGSARISISSLSEDVATAASDGIRVYGVRKNGSLEVTSVEGAAPVAVKSGFPRPAFWIATGNNSLFLATSASPGENKVTITSISA